MSQSTKMGLIVGGIVVALLIGVPLIWGSGGWGMMGPGMMGGFGWGFMPLFGILFWGLVIWGVVAVIRGTARTDNSDRGGDREDSALDVLKKKYARGEIGREEFEEKKRELV